MSFNEREVLFRLLFSNKILNVYGAEQTLCRPSVFIPERCGCEVRRSGDVVLIPTDGGGGGGYGGSLENFSGTDISHVENM